MTVPPMPLQWLTPLPPLKTGIAYYSRDLLRAVDGSWNVRTILEDGSSPMPEPLSTVEMAPNTPDPGLPLVIQVGNSEYHRRAFRVATEQSGILVLHDVVLHHARASDAIRHGTSKAYWRELQARYGAAGVQAGKDILRGRVAADLSNFPLCEKFVERARLTIVHSEHAKALVERRCSDSAVVCVPMGVPLPALVDRDAARDRLGLPRSQFIMSSITHVNSNKRLPVVLRAVRKIVARVPEFRLVLAGTGSDSEEIEREVRMLGIDSFVKRWGFIDERHSRLLAAASDACVNLRYPSTGETSASLLRLLAAGRPVLVSDGSSTSDLPAGVGLRIPVGRHEAEFIAETVWSLVVEEAFRQSSGRLARKFVESRHSMGAAIDGYRSAIEQAYALTMPSVDRKVVLEEVPPDLESFDKPRPRPTRSTERVSAAIGELGLGGQSRLIDRAARAIVALNLDRVTADSAPITRPGPALISRLVCPACRATLRFDGERLTCRSCSRDYPVDGGIPDLLPKAIEN